MKKYQLNAKLKILIIVFYTLILFGVILLTLGNKEYTRFEAYGNQSYDDNIAISIREMENRKSIYSTGSSKEVGEHEKSTYDLQVSLIKLQTKAVIKNIKLYISARTADDGYRYKEYSSNTKTMSEYTYTSTTSFSSFANTEYVEKDVEDKHGHTTTEEFFFNEKPQEFFIKVTYTVGDSEDTQTLTYKTSVLEFNEKKLESATKRDIIASDSINNAKYVDPQEDPVRICLTKEETTEKSTAGAVKTDLLKVQFNVLKTNLNKYRIAEEELKANVLKGIEIPKAIDAEDAWDVYPEISEIKFEVYAKVNNAEEGFSQYVKVYSIYGFMSKYRDLAIASIKIDECYEIEDIYVVAEGKIHNGNKDSFSILYNCKYSELVNAE